MSLACEGGRCTVQGPITMANVTGVLAESETLFASPTVVVDLAGVTEVDSAALSLLLEWRREAARAKRQVSYTKVPANLKSLAELYGVSHLIGA